MLAALPGSALAQSSPAGLPDAGSGLLQVLAGLAVVIAALLASLWLLKRLSVPRGSGAGALHVVAGAAVGPRERVVLVEVQETWLLLGVAPGRVSALYSMPKGRLPAAASAPEDSDFAGRLQRLMARRHDDAR